MMKPLLTVITLEVKGQTVYNTSIELDNHVCDLSQPTIWWQKGQSTKDRDTEKSECFAECSKEAKIWIDNPSCNR